MADEGAALRTRKFQTNRLLNRKQFVVDILHPTKPNLSKDEVRTRLSSTHKVPKETVQTFGFRTQFGGGKSTGFALIYDSETDLKKFEPHYRKVRIGVAAKIEKPSRQQRKQRKNRSKKFRGTDKKKAASTEKKGAKK